MFPTFKVTAITHRKDPIYPATVVGIPPMEDVWMGKATERLFLPLIRLFLPEILDVCMPAEGVFHNLVLVRLAKRYPGHARKVIHGLWGLGLLMLAKAMVVVDEWVDVQNLSQSAWQVLGNVDWSRDVIVEAGPVDHLDHAASSPSAERSASMPPPNGPKKAIPATGPKWFLCRPRSNPASTRYWRVSSLHKLPQGFEIINRFDVMLAPHDFYKR